MLLESGQPLLSQFRNRILTAKAPLCLLVAFSSFVGFIIASRELSGTGVITFIGVFCLACGAASLNSYQECRSDRFLRRTRERPLPKGAMAPGSALQQARVLLAGGFLILYGGSHSLSPVWVGIAAVILYNFVYTPLKYKTIWSLIPGALCGALPPLIGWLAAGRSPSDSFVLGLSVLLAVWQIPHFWLVVLRNSEDYQASQLPSVIKVIPGHHLHVLLIVWIIALVVITHTLLLMFDQAATIYKILLSLSSLGMLIIFLWQIWLTKQTDYRFLFMVINSFMFLTMLFISLGSIV